ncbi:hypothetical protein HX867_33300, partial [Pseudomonas gingeri]|nr:hypothetical protein [Pseudomonas gingeri]
AYLVLGALLLGFKV